MEITLSVIKKKMKLLIIKKLGVKMNLLELWESEDFERIPICSDTSNKNC